MLEIEISMSDLTQILNGNLTYYILNKTQYKNVPIVNCLFIAHNNQQTYAAIKTLMTPTKIYDKYVVSLHKQFGFHQDIAWFKQDQKHPDLHLCLTDGTIVRKNKQGQIYYDEVWN